MKRIYFIILILATFILFARSALLGQWIVVCIDPGHGGPGASKYGTNGDGQGTDGPLPNGEKLSEQWVNLQVSLALKDSLDSYGMRGRVSMTRTTETQYVTLEERAYKANFANCDPDPEFCAVAEFIPIHHNGLELWEQGTETFWCNRDSVQIGLWKYDRNQAYLLAQKIYWRLRDKFTYPPYDPRECKMVCYEVLRNTIMASCFSEGTNMHNEAEAILFDDPDLAHVKDEASAIFRGWRSYHENNGVVTVAVRGLCDLGGNVIVDYVDRLSPYYTSWTFSDMEPHHMCAYEVLNHVCGESEYTYYYHHWKELETGYTTYWPYNCLYEIVNPSESTHTYVAYYRGGPYYADLYWPDGGVEWFVGNYELVSWMGTSYGLDSTTLIDVYLDRNSGQGGYPEKLFSNISILDGLGALWQVTGPASNKCRIKIVAHDCVYNTATDVSSYDFIIRYPNISGDVNTDGIVSLADIVYLINYLFKLGPGFEPLWKGDTNGDCNVSVADVVWLINYLFKGGPTPTCNDSCWACMR